MVKVDIVDENDTPLKGKRAFFKDFNQNNKTEIALLEQIPDIKRRIDTVFSNANRKWGEKQYEWSQWKTSQGHANRELTRRRADELRIRKELTQRKADESRASMIARNIPGSTRRVGDTILSFTARGSNKKRNKTKRKKRSKGGSGTSKNVGKVYWYDAVDFIRSKQLEAYNKGIFGRFMVVFPEIGIELPLTNDATRLINPEDTVTDNPNFESWDNILLTNLQELEAKGKTVPRKTPQNPRLILKYYQPTEPTPQHDPYPED